MKLTKRQVENIIEVVHDWSSFDVETNGFRDYEVIPYMDKLSTEKVQQIINEKILTDRKASKWPKFWRSK